MFEWISDVIARGGLLGVGLLAFLENLVPPIPSELVIPLAGFLAARGEMSLAAVIVVATAGSLLGAVAWYEAGRRVGEARVRRWVERHGRWLTLSVADVDRSQEWFVTHGGRAVLLGRLVPGVRAFISLPAGFAAMPRLPFLLYSAIGTALWISILAGSGVLLQANYAMVSGSIDIATDVMLAAFIAMMLWRYARCWKRASRS